MFYFGRASLNSVVSFEYFVDLNLNSVRFPNWSYTSHSMDYSSTQDAIVSLNEGLGNGTREPENILIPW